MKRCNEFECMVTLSSQFIKVRVHGRFYLVRYRINFFVFNCQIEIECLLKRSKTLPNVIVNKSKYLMVNVFQEYPY